jgi:cell division protein FtsL
MVFTEKSRPGKTKIPQPSSPWLTAAHGGNAQSGREQLTPEFFSLLRRLLAGIAVIILALSQFLHWRVSQAQAGLERLAAVNADVRREHASLTAERDELASKPRIAAAAAVRLGLQLPQKEQEHRLY